MPNTVVNALGQTLYYSGTSTSWFSATGSGPTLYGTAGNDSIWGDGSVNVTMVGGTGDDIYYLYSSINHASEAPGAGVDTINTWMDYTLPANFENLTVTGDGRHAFGNSADNIITGGTGSQTIDGGAGNDVLIGGGGADTFIFTKGNGSDLITDFGSDDKVRLNQYGLTSFDQVVSHLTQEGANLRLDLGGGESLVFANKTAADLHSDQFQLGLDRSDLTQTFSDDFNTLSLHQGTQGTWDAKYWWAPDKGSSMTGELQWYVNPSYAPTASANPFSVSNGVLTISAKPTPDALKSLVDNHDYTSGLLNTHSTFSQTYGYFEMRAEMPHDQGTWPAFWLLPEDGSWPPELDVVEMRGQEPSTVNVTVHSNATGQHTMQSIPVQVPSTDGFHNYGVLWDQDQIVWYFDDVAVAHADTPADMHSPMYMVVDLAVGGIAGTPADGLKNGSEMKIDYIKAYSLDDHTTQTAAALSTHSPDWHI
ncbi:family 16 glycosylhydrolase [Rhizobium leucaenae]|uniref:Beta-glucanase (GH16 family) n=1 Tax=Rhizobium leucaenae TaxID=29450 RepID=A0A7W6ZU23_9HYPH|nr:family 16 glycosylhydrolase [Rhizobium leucaenae]MBB4568766.1 beta-glucanase (GH16 family) [Rhizobium leucaenae]MBB6302156.1 beta-glucanase (GH16 family) [Rhizobium leucaenae]